MTEFGAAIDLALGHAMVDDPKIVVFGEDTPLLRRELLVRFGPERVRPTPISESAFLGAAVGAALGGLRPVVEVQLVDFLMVGLSALVNEAAKIEAFSGGRWNVPIVVRATCGGGYGDAGQHEQALWGMLAGVPGLAVVVPSTPADAAGLMRASIENDGPVVFLEHKLLSRQWRDAMAGGRRESVTFDVPPDGADGPVLDPPPPVPLGSAIERRLGGDVTLISLGVGVHRCLSASEELGERGVECTVIDVRSVAPLDRAAIETAARRTGRVVAVDEDYTRGGLSGEIAAVVAEAGISARFARVTTEDTIPYARHLEDATLPNVDRIVSAVESLLD
ncbi:MAG: transketolase C-terminal domain-containing protein [Acidimicrobiia bacterium]|nr:transketolase C-terminal domain-containing protein [Acidimicrobiia bacterium]